MTDPWAEFAKSYTIHQESRDLIDFLVSKGAKPFHTCTLDEARKLYLDVAVSGAGTIYFEGQVQELSVPSPDTKGGIPVSVYKPSKCAATPAIFIYFHGGGLVLFERKCYETALKTIARESGCIVVNVECRLLPDQGKGYAPFDDAVAVTKWVLENKEKVGGVAGSKVGVGGDITGGQLAISVTNDVRGLDFQILIYPHADTTLSQPSVKEFVNLPVLSAADVKWFLDLIVADLPNQATDPRVNALARKNLHLAPPALILLAQLDPLRDGGLAFAEKLKSAGVKVNTVVIEGVPEVFFGMCAIFKTKCQEAYGHIVKFIKQFQ